MNQTQLIIKRLKKPSVILSLTSQLVTIILLFNNTLDRELITSLITSTTSILVILGIISNPDTLNKGYHDDFMTCSNCQNKTAHICIKGEMICTECGCICKTNHY